MGINAKSFSGLADFSTYYFKIEGTEYSVSTRKSPSYLEVTNLINKVIQPKFKSEIIGKDRDQDIIIYKVIGSKKRAVTIDRGTTGKDLFSSLIGWHGFKQEKANSAFQPSFSFIATSPKIGFNKENILEVDRSYLASGSICIISLFRIELDVNANSLLNFGFTGKSKIEAYVVGPTGRKSSIKKKLPSKSLLGFVELNYSIKTKPLLISGSSESLYIKNFDTVGSFKLSSPSGSANVSLAGARRTTIRKTGLGPSGELEATDFSGLFDHTTYYFKVNSIEYSITTDSAPTFQDVANLINSALTPNYDSFLLVDSDGVDIWIRNRYEPGYTGEVNLAHSDTSPDLFYSLAYWSGFRKSVVYGYSRGPEALIMNFTDVGGSISTSGAATYSLYITGLYIGSGVLFGLGGSSYTIVFAFGLGAGGAVFSGSSTYEWERTPYVASGSAVFNGAAATERDPVEMTYYPVGVEIVLSGTSINVVDDLPFDMVGLAEFNGGAYPEDVYCELYWHYHGGAIVIDETMSWAWEIELLFDMVGSLTALGGMAPSTIEITAAAIGGMAFSGASTYINPISDWIFVGDGIVELNTYYTSLGLSDTDLNLGMGLNGEPITHYYTVGGIGSLGGTAEVRTVFTMTWKTDNAGGETNDDQIKLPLDSGGTYNFTVYWGDTTSSTITAWDDADVIHTYSVAGTYDVTIDGICNGFGFASGDATKLIDIKQWGGAIQLHNNGHQFKSCINLTYSAIDSPDLSNITDMSEMFSGASLFNGNLSSWDVSNVTDMSSMFACGGSSSFNGDITSWDTGSVTDMSWMFSLATKFNQNIGSWDVSKVVNMEGMFDTTDAFNQDLSAWDVGSVTDMSWMFNYAKAFNGDLWSWDTGKVTDMNGMFYGAESFNKDISAGPGWNTSNVTNMSEMFSGAKVFNNEGANINWDTSKVTNMLGMFYGADAFDVAFDGDWDTSSITDMSYMFYSADLFNQNINDWDVSKVTTMQYMFKLAISFNQNLNSWIVSNVTNMKGIFGEAEVFNGNISSWDVSKVTNMSSMFQYALKFNQDISGWITSSATDMSTMFDGTDYFNQDITGWDTSKVTNMAGMFSSTGAFNYSLNSWDVSKVTNFSWMFYDCKYNADIGSWITSSATDMTAMFRDNSYFNVDIGSWDVSKVTSMIQMFYNAAVFNQNIGGWDTGSVTSMVSMFDTAAKFNQDIGGWDVSKVESMEYMFESAYVFNQNIGGWNTGNVTDMGAMFDIATKFNQDLSNWDTSKVTSMIWMFCLSAFDRNIGDWDISSLTDASDMFNSLIIRTNFYDDLLNGWGAQSINDSVKFSAGTSKYSAVGDASRTHLVDTHLWTITDGGSGGVDFGNYGSGGISLSGSSIIEVESIFNPSGSVTLSGIAYTKREPEYWEGTGGVDLSGSSINSVNRIVDTSGTATLSGLATTIGLETFITSWRVVAGTGARAPSARKWVTGWDPGAPNLKLHLDVDGTYNFTVWWGDGTSNIITTYNQPEATHQYSVGGTYEILICGTCEGFGFDGGSYTSKLLDVKQWGRVKLHNKGYQFAECDELTGFTATDELDISNITNMSYMFYDCYVFDQDLSSWDVSNVTNMEYMFSYASVFNGNISGWKTGNVTSINNIFENAEAFNQNIGSWDVGKITNMSGMFNSATVFDQNISGWNVSNVTDFTGMFASANAFNQDITGWDISSATTIEGMFSAALNFNQDITKWDTSSVTNMASLFSGSTSFSTDLSDFDISAVTNMSYIFASRTSNIPGVENWDVSKVSNMTAMFQRSSSIPDISGWNVSGATIMDFMFYEVTGIIPDISGWSPNSCISMKQMFRECDQPFLQNLNSWDVSKVTDMSSMFYQNLVFNGDISGWDVSSVKTMSSMFAYATAFNQDISGWTTSSLTNMYNMFTQASSFNQNIGSWDISNVTDMTYIFYYCTLSTSKYDAILNGWDAQVPKTGVHFHGGYSKYSTASSTARAALISDHSWVFDGDGGTGNAFRWNYILGGGIISGAVSVAVDRVVATFGESILSGAATTSVEV